jgi:type IV secretory pathway TrbF-like protein
MKDIKLMGYAQMRNVNYRKNDEPFIVTTTVFPIYDVSSCATPSEEKEPEQAPVITHFASVMTNVELVNLDPIRLAQSKAADLARLMRVKKDYSFDEGVHYIQIFKARVVFADFI